MSRDLGQSQTVVPTLYQEVQLSPSLVSPSSIVNISTTTSSSQQLTIFGAGRKRNHDEISGLDEEIFARKYLATEASVFFRRKGAIPRRFLWRVLDDRKLLEIQCVDLVKKKGGVEGTLTFHIGLPVAIAKGGVAFADVEEPDALDVFVLTTGYELFTVRLRKSLLLKSEAPESNDLAKLVKKFAPGAFAYRYPYRMLAVSSLEIIVSLHDGGLVQLQRQPSGDGSEWQETIYSEESWTMGTLRGLNPLKRRQTIRYGELELETSAGADMAKSPDGTHVWTVGLDHTLKAWSTKTGKVVHQMDLAKSNSGGEGQRRQPRFLMTPEQSTIIRVVQAPDVNAGAVVEANAHRPYHLFVHSPEDHQFKMYEIRPTFSSIEGEGLRCTDQLPTVKLIPPIDELLNTNIWHLEEFYVKPGPGLQDTRIWLRARSGALCKTFTMTFDPTEPDADEVRLSFRDDWSVVDNGLLSLEAMKSCDSYPGHLISSADTFATPTERWTAFLFYPGRFSIPSVEATLNIYRKKRKLGASAVRGLNTTQLPLQQRLIAAVTSKIILNRSANDQPAYEEYQANVHEQWMAFYSILEDLHARRLESLALAFDTEDGLPWCVDADILAPIRMNDELETACRNAYLLEEDVPKELQHAVYPDDKNVAAVTLMEAARQLRRSISPRAQAVFSSLALHEALAAGDDEESVGIDGLCERADLDNEIDEEKYKVLQDDVDALNGVGCIDSDMFLQILEDLADTLESRRIDKGKALCRYGSKLFLAVAQQTLQQNERILLDLLLLLTFMAELLPIDGLDANMRPAEVYDAILLRLRHNALRQWLASHEHVHRATDAEATSQPLTSAYHTKEWDARTDVPYNSEMTTLLTSWTKRWTFGIDLYEDWTGFTTGVFAELLREELFDLAADFAKFVPIMPWSTYLRGRLHVAQGEYDLAALAFNEAAEGLSKLPDMPKSLIAQTGFLSIEEKNYFGVNRSYYYQHVASVFEKLRAYSYTADFATQAIDHFSEAVDVDRNIARVDALKANPNSPAKDRIDLTTDEIKFLRIKERRDDIAARLFNALVQTARFREAYDTLRKTKSALEKANLKTLVETCIKQNAVTTLLELPLTDELAADADAVLLALAKKTLASGSTTAVQHHQILYAFRTSRGDFRGAAEILHEYLERLRGSNERAVHLQDPEDETVLQAFLLLINTLTCCGEGEGWLLVEPIPWPHEVERKRRLVTLEEIRREYEAELDRRSEVLQGRFPLVGGAEEMDVF